MGRIAAVLAAAWLAGLAAGGATCAAAPLAEAQADRSALVQGLQAQFEATLIRERKLADDRELSLMSALEAQLRQARAKVDAAKGDAGAAKAALASARSDYAELAALLSARDTSARADIAAHQAQAQADADQASPALAAALQRFADGDRLGAWPTIEALITAAGAEKGATDESRAAGQRRLAELREVMRDHGEAGASYMMALKGKPAGPEQSDFNALIARAKLAHDQGDLSRARAAAERALAAAATDDEHATTLKLIGEQAAGQRDTQVAQVDYGQALAILERLASADPSQRNQADLAGVLKDKGDLQVTLGDLAAPRPRMSEASPSISVWLTPTPRQRGSKRRYRPMSSISARWLSNATTQGRRRGLSDESRHQPAARQGRSRRRRLSAVRPARFDPPGVVAGRGRGRGRRSPRSTT